MSKMRVSLFAALALLAACGSQVQSSEAAPASADDATSASSQANDEAAWRAEIEAWAQEAIAGEQLGLSPEMTNIFFGDFSGDGLPDALLYAEARGPTSITVVSALFRNEDGHMTFVRRVEDVFGSAPENVQFAQGQVTLTTTFMEGPNAGQSENWTIRAAP